MQVWLGCPASTDGERGAAAAQDGTASKVGGTPWWAGEHGDWSATLAMAGRAGPDCCGKCGQALLFVGQVYAPVHDAAVRTLFFFACNHEACPDRAASWRAIRLETPVGQQAPKQASRTTSTTNASTLDSDSDSKVAVAVTGKVAVTKSASTAPAALAWGEEDVSIDALEAMLQTRDDDAAALAAVAAKAAADAATSAPPKPTQSSSNAKKKKTKKKSTTSSRRSQASGVLLAVFAEPVSSPSAASASDEAHAMELLRRYKLGNPDEADVVALAAPAPAGAEHDSDADSRHSQDSDGAALALAEASEAFQARLRREPSQCLRYAYGGAPLWPTSGAKRRAAPALAKVPNCRVCGAARVFELQLVPALLWQLQQQLQQNALFVDFATVLLFSCPKSCWTYAPVDEACLAVLDEV